MPRIDPRLATPPSNVNEDLQDRIVRHMLYLEGYKSSVAGDVVKKLDEDVIPALEVAVFQRLNNLPKGAITTGRLQEVLAGLTAIAAGIRPILQGTQQELFDFAQYEAELTQRIVDDVFPVKLNTTLPNPLQLRAAVIATPFDGRNLQEWYDKLTTSTQERLSATIKRGYIEGQTTQQIVRNVMGEGVINGTRRNVEAVVRTAVGNTANVARESFYAQNTQVIKGVKYVATLDARTTPRCRSLDGKVFFPNEGPRPPQHVGCRSSTSPVTRSWQELGIEADGLDEGTRASMNGQLPKDITYAEWIKKQPRDIQEMALGKTRAKLLRDGGLEVGAFTNRNGVQYTLNELKQREATAFDKADL